VKVVVVEMVAVASVRNATRRSSMFFCSTACLPQPGRNPPTSIRQIISAL
jgi:hypothetical protein